MPSHISEVEKAEQPDLREFMQTARQKFKVLNSNLYDEEEEEEDSEEEHENLDPTQYPLYARLNNLRRMRENNARKFARAHSTTAIHKKTLVNANMEFSKPEHYEGIYFKSQEDFGSYMQMKYTSKVETLNIYDMYKEVDPTSHTYKRDAGSMKIKSLKITDDEYQQFEKHQMLNKSQRNQDVELSLFEFVVEFRLKNILRKIPLSPRATIHLSERHRSITWNELTSLKYSITHFLQTRANKIIIDKNFDSKKFSGADPRKRLMTDYCKTHRENKVKTYMLIQKLRDITNIMRSIYPQSKPKDELSALFQGHYHTLRLKPPPATTQTSKMPNVKGVGSAKNFINLIK